MPPTERSGKSIAFPRSKDENWAMCDSYRLPSDADQIVSQFRIENEKAEIGEKYRLDREVFPGDVAPVLILQSEERVLKNYKWGVWNSKTQKYETVARIESFKTSPLWKDAVKSSRCLIPASSFYEWKTLSDTEKINVEINPKSTELFAFAGLHVHYHEGGQIIPGFAIVTVPASLEMTPVGERQPGVIAQEDYSSWLDGAADPISLVRSERSIIFEIKKDPPPEDEHTGSG